MSKDDATWDGHTQPTLPSSIGTIFASPYWQPWGQTASGSGLLTPNNSPVHTRQPQHLAYTEPRRVSYPCWTPQDDSIPMDASTAHWTASRGVPTIHNEPYPNARHGPAAQTCWLNVAPHEASVSSGTSADMLAGHQNHSSSRGGYPQAAGASQLGGVASDDRGTSAASSHSTILSLLVALKGSSSTQRRPQEEPSAVKPYPHRSSRRRRQRPQTPLAFDEATHEVVPRQSSQKNQSISWLSQAAPLQARLGQSDRGHQPRRRTNEARPKP